MRIKPKTLLFAFYLLINFAFYIRWFVLGELGGDFAGFAIGDKSSYLIIGALELLLMLAFYCIYRFLLFPTVKAKQINIEKRPELFLALFVFILQCLFLVYTAYTGVGRLGADWRQSIDIGPTKYFFTLFTPDYLTLIYLTLCRKGNMCRCNLLVFFVSNVFRGWIAGALLNLLAIYLIRKFQHGVKLKQIVIIVAALFIISPSIYYVKFVTRDAEVESWDAYKSYYSPEKYGEIFSKITSRFQHMSETYSIVMKRDKVERGYDDGKFVPLWFDHHFRLQLANTFKLRFSTLAEFVASDVRMRVIGGNIHTGILPWLTINWLVALHYIVFFIVSNALLAFFTKSLTPKYALSLALWFWTLYFMHGWITSYYILLLSYFEIYLLFRYFKFRKSRQQNKEQSDIEKNADNIGKNYNEMAATI